MNSDIQRLANNLIYDGHLRCGSHQVATQKISYKMDPATAIETWPFAVERPIGDINMAWAVAALDPSKGAVFIDTDCVPGTESRAEGADIAQNDVEIKIIKVLTSILLACGVEGRDVGLLSPYRTQLKQLEIEYGVRGIEMHTIDRYQGRDANIIIISFVRSNIGLAIGDLLRDWHRINVAITRARYKLIMVGSSSTLQRSPLLGGIIRILGCSGCVVQIPHKAPIPATTGSSISSAPASVAHPAAVNTARTAGGSALIKRLPITANIIAEYRL
ncbi:AAA domain-containing protein [Kickxella alabastrina]|uniref:AAA domain-containing protein n=1 Tax=Kickxella alabastrina TaxID=61397 RepID=UPI00221FF7E7|nr:AAA domain-containing protein [Kickxella alabastrina]KAI7826673.1 AAA domain-containing protein [Kickxella alabastrina]